MGIATSASLEDAAADAGPTEPEKKTLNFPLNRLIGQVQSVPYLTHRGREGFAKGTVAGFTRAALAACGRRRPEPHGAAAAGRGAGQTTSGPTRTPRRPRGRMPTPQGR